MVTRQPQIIQVETTKNPQLMVSMTPVFEGMQFLNLAPKHITKNHKKDVKKLPAATANFLNRSFFTKKPIIKINCGKQNATKNIIKKQVNTKNAETQTIPKEWSEDMSCPILLIPMQWPMKLFPSGISISHEALKGLKKK